MDATPRSDITRILERMQGDEPDPRARQELYRIVYDELRRIAAGLLRRERAGHTLQPTALVHEAYLKLAGGPGPDWKGRAHFLGVSARAMRQVLVDHARARAAAKRGGGVKPVTLIEDLDGGGGRELELLALDDALTRLAAEDPRGARVVELRVFAGLTMEEIAAVLGVSRRTTDGDWAVARMWLARELRPEGAS